MAVQQPIFNPDPDWRNFHETYKQKVKGRFDLHFPDLHPDGPTIDDLNETTRQFQKLIAGIKAKGQRARAVGSRWSLSKAPATDGVVLNTNRLNGIIKLRPEHVHPLYPGTADQRGGLFLFQCGNTVADVNEVLESKVFQRSLRTTGAANGQTIVGATSTGTHGSALEFGALHDHIVAIHLIPTGGEQFWIERKSRPVLADAFVAKFGTHVKREDDDMFNAVVMSFGSFGVIASVVIETRPRFLLETNCKVFPMDEALWKAVGDLDFSAHPFFAGKPDPYYFQAVINPNNMETIVNANYEKACPADYEPKYGLRQEPGAIGPGFDTLTLVGKILDLFPKAIPPFATVVARQLVDMDPDDGTWGEVFGYKAPLLHVASGSVAVSLTDARRTLEILVKLNKDMGAVPLVLGCRYVRKSPALLAFNRFPKTLAVSIDGVDSARSRDYFAKAADRLEAAGIPFTQHWGKTNAYTKKRLDKVYGANVATWLAVRKKLIPDPADRAVFTNAYMEERGLAG